MRMWNVDPALMCDKHLLGEHLEMHMFAGIIGKKKIVGFIDKGLVETHNIVKRHEGLVQEMGKRGMNHKSKLIIDWLEVYAEGKVDVESSMKLLSERCEKCRRRINEYNQSSSR